MAPQEPPERHLARDFSDTEMIPEKLRWVPHCDLTYLRIWVWIWLWVLGFGRWAGSWGRAGEWDPLPEHKSIAKDTKLVSRRPNDFPS